MKYTITPEASATHVWITYAMLQNGKPNMAEQEQILFVKGNEKTPAGWIEVYRQYGKASGPGVARLGMWSDTSRDEKEAVRIQAIEKEAADKAAAIEAARVEAEIREAKRLAEIEAQKKVSEVKE
jgi:hypothetical protein